MEKKRRFKVRGLVSHQTPEGSYYLSERDYLMKKFNSGDISAPELKKLVNFLLIEKRKTHVLITIWGKTLNLTIEEYEEHYAPYLKK